MAAIFRFQSLVTFTGIAERKPTYDTRSFPHFTAENTAESVANTFLSLFIENGMRSCILYW